MSEAAWHTPEGLDPRLDMELGYGGTFLNPFARFEVYKYAADVLFEGKLDIHDRIIYEELAPTLLGNETIVDWGCSRGEVLGKIRLLGHKGPLFGYDLNDSWQHTIEEIEQAGLLPIEFRQSNVLQMDLPDNSVDVLLALFIMYHLPVEEGLELIYRKLAPGGRGIFATSGKKNKSRHRELELITVEEFKRQNGYDPGPPIRFAQPFDSDNALLLLPQHFDEVIPHPPQQTKMIIETEEAKEKYILSLITMWTAFKPPIPGGDWNRALDKARKIIEAEMRLNGRFVDYIDRQYFTAYKAA